MMRNLWVAVFMSALLLGCGGGSTGSLTPSVASQAVAIINGKVLDKAGQPIAGATVAAGSKSVQSGTDGSYQIQVDPVAKSVVVLAKKDGYGTNAKEVFVTTSETSLLDVTLFPEDTRATISSAAGGTVIASNKASVKIEPNSIQTSDGKQYAGSVTVSVSYRSPDTLDGVRGFPAPYAGVDGGDQALLRSVGVIEVKLTDMQGNALQLDGKTPATLTFPASSVAQGEASIPLWFYDENQKTWIREGEASRQADGSYIGQVKHFTLWNCDLPSYARNGPTKIKGCVVDMNGNPITRGLIVQVEGRGWRAASDTDGLGNFEMPVPPNVDVYIGYAVGGQYVVPQAKLSTQLALGETRQLSCQVISAALDPKVLMTLPPFSSIALPTTGNGGSPAGTTTPPPASTTTTPVDAQAFAGAYVGTYGGAETGTFNVNIASNGNISGVVHSATYSLNTSVLGTISPSGALSMTTSGVAGAATFIGSISQSTGVATGSWNYTGATGGGTFTGQKQP